MIHPRKWNIEILTIFEKRQSINVNPGELTQAPNPRNGGCGTMILAVESKGNQLGILNYVWWKLG